jgi:hypothetical protein
MFSVHHLSKRHIMDPNSFGMFTFYMKFTCLSENGELSKLRKAQILVEMQYTSYNVGYDTELL